MGARFDGGRLPVDVLSDISAFRDLIIAVAKNRWLKEHPGRQRLPRGFNHSVSFDLIDVKEGSAAPQLQWDRRAAEHEDAELAQEIGALFALSFGDAANLFKEAAESRFPTALPADQIAALNKFGSSLLPHEKIEFVGQNDEQGNVIYLDSVRRARLITRVSETYVKRYAGSGELITSSSDGYIVVGTREYGKISIPLPPSIVVTHYDGNLGSDVQFDLQVVLDSKENFRRVQDCLDVTIVDASDAPEFRDAMSRIADLRTLNAGWLDGAGEAIAQIAVMNARLVLAQRPDIVKHSLGVFPTDEGGITLEMENDGWLVTIELLSSGAIEFYGAKSASFDTIEPLAFTSVNDEFVKAISSRLGSFAK